MVKRILLGVCDPEHTAVSSEYAREIAQHHAAKITIAAVTDERRLRDVGPVAMGAGSFAKEMIDERLEQNETLIRESIERLKRLFEKANIDHTVISPEGAPYEALTNLSRYHDLMIFGGQGLMEHGITNEPSHEIVHLIQHGVRPILSTRKEYHPITRILVAYSGSVESAHTIRQMTHLQIWPESECRLVHFGKPQPETENLVQDMASYLNAHVAKVECDVVDEPAKSHLVKEALQWKADMIVVGNSAKSLLRRRMFGETALQAIHDSPLPLFLSQ